MTTTDYNQIIQRDMTDSPDPRELPQVVSRQVLEGAVAKSAALQLMKVQAMPARTERMPALSMLPEAQWQSGASQQAKDIAAKKTTFMQWKNVTMSAEELAITVPIPDAFIADTGVDLFAEIQPRLSEAFAAALDAAVFFGIKSPWTNPDSDSIYKRAVAAGNVRQLGTSTDIAGDVAVLARDLVEVGYNPQSMAVEPGFSWRLNAERTAQGVSPYNPGGGVDSEKQTLYGKPLVEVVDGAWDSTRANLILGDFSRYAMIGIRQDITFKLFDQGVITDASGAVQYNAITQDLKILRVVMRVAFASVAPISAINPTYGAEYPFACLRPSGAPAS
jgi:HK97 family phage major capsid protein